MARISDLDDRQFDAELGPTLGPLVKAVGDYIIRRIRDQGESSDWVSQHGSSLGPRNHCAKVTELLAEGHNDVARKRGKHRELRRDVYDAACSERARPLAKAEDKQSKWDRVLGGSK